jgi:succinate dehydrogenase/fumarate reductase flavoprotein subunit
MQKQKGYEDSPDLAFRDWVRWGQGEADEEWARYFIEQSFHGLYEWLESLGVVWVDVNFAEGNSVPRIHRPQGLGRGVAMNTDLRAWEGA